MPQQVRGRKRIRPWGRASAWAASLLLLGPGAAARAESPPASGSVTFSGSLRSRVESWDWFLARGGKSRYTYVGTLLRLSAAGRQPRQDWWNTPLGAKAAPAWGPLSDWQVELAVPWLAGLPTSSQAPPPEGPLGFGAIYRAANGSQAADLFLKQGFLRFHHLGGPANALRLGRFEFVDGLEVLPRDATLAALERDRIAHRLLGNFGWSHVGRSFDGLQLTRDLPRLNVTLLAARPTRGAFDLHGWDELNVEVYYASATRALASAGEGRLFWLYYVDHRDAVKVDNRPAAARSTDKSSLRIHSVGGHFVHTYPAASGTVDLLLWGTAQFGDWGRQSHHAGAFAAEAGYQPKSGRLRPWLRGGVNWGSGDKNPSDGEHNTFFQVLPTPRVYARFPFYNMMNTTDWFASAILRPQARWTLRLDYHNLRLSRRADLWYQGGGAFQNQPSFGYIGRPSGGNSSLADMFDVSLDYSIARATSLTLYAGWAIGGGVVKNVYPTGQNASLIYLELNQKL